MCLWCDETPINVHPTPSHRSSIGDLRVTQSCKFIAFTEQTAVAATTSRWDACKQHFSSQSKWWFCAAAESCTLRPGVHERRMLTEEIYRRMCFKKTSAVTLSNLNRFSIISLLKTYEICYKKNTKFFSIPSLCCWTILGSRKTKFVINYKKYNLEIVPDMIKMRYVMSYAKWINTVTPVAHVSIICAYTWSKMTAPLVCCIVSNAVVYATLSIQKALL